MAVRALNFYISCTLSKTVRVPKQFSLATIRTNSLEPRFHEWINRLDSAKSQKVVPIEFYSGGQWSVLRNLHQQAIKKGFQLRCRVVSAGYGLISISEQICPYAATFTLGHRESISKGNGKTASKRHRLWWEMLSKWNPNYIDGPRSFREIFKEDPQSIHLIALSPIYLDAISQDLIKGKAALANKSNLIIISSAQRCEAGLRDHVITTQARLQSCLGGPLMSLNVRLAANLALALLSGSLKSERVRYFVQRLLSKSEPRQSFARLPASDKDVSSFIERALQNNADIFYSPLLRHFRDSGRACAMKRFKTIFETTQSQFHEKKKIKKSSKITAQTRSQAQCNHSPGNKTRSKQQNAVISIRIDE